MLPKVSYLGYGARWYHSVRWFTGHTPHLKKVEAYRFGLSSEANLEKVEDHLLICEQCQDDVVSADRYIQATRQAVEQEAGKRLRSIHVTDDGPIFGAMRRAIDGKWIARHWGRQLDGLRVCGSVEEADAYLTESLHPDCSLSFCMWYCVGV